MSKLINYPMRALKIISLCSFVLYHSASLSQDIELTSVIRTSHRILGEIAFTLEPSGELIVDSSDLDIILAKVLAKSELERIRSHANSENKLTSEELKRIGYPITLDSQHFELFIDIPFEKNTTNSISLANNPGITASEDASKFSGYLNAYLKASLLDTGSISDLANAHRFKAGMHYAGINFLYESEIVDGTDAGVEYNRTFSQLNYDSPEQGTRFMLGDITIPTAYLQSSADILGFGISRNFSDIPTRNLRPSASRSFTLRSHSHVDVLVDGISIRKMYLPAGKYDLDDIPLTHGLNNIELLIEDDAGNQESISFSIAVDSALIKQGEYEYAVTIGTPSEIINNKLHYGDSNFLATGFLEYGLLTSATLGFSGQYFDESWMIGARALAAWKFGGIEINFNYSDHKLAGSGSALRLSYSSPSDLRKRSTLSFNAQYEYFSSKFSSVNEIGEDFSGLVQHSVRTSLSRSLLDSYRGSLDLSLRKSYAKQDNLAWAVGAAIAGPISDTGISFGINVRYGEDFSSPSNAELTANLSYHFKPNHYLNLRYHGSEGAMGLGYSHRKSPYSVGGYSISASMEKDGSRSSFDGELGYTANRAHLGVEQSNSYASLYGGEMVSRTSVSVDTALAFSGGSLAIGRPVGSSFMVLSPNKNLSSHTIKVGKNGDGSAHVVSYNGANVLVSNLNAYSTQVVDFEIPDLPIGYDLGSGLFSVRPNFGQAYQFEIGTEAAHTVTASIIDAKTRSPISLVVGKAYKPEDPSHKIDFFTSKKGRIAISGLSVGDWVLELETEPTKSVVISVMETPDLLDKKGDLYVEHSSSSQSF